MIIIIIIIFVVAVAVVVFVVVGSRAWSKLCDTACAVTEI